MYLFITFMGDELCSLFRYLCSVLMECLYVWIFPLVEDFSLKISGCRFLYGVYFVVVVIVVFFFFFPFFSLLNSKLGSIENHQIVFHGRKSYFWLDLKTFVYLLHFVGNFPLTSLYHLTYYFFRCFSRWFTKVGKIKKCVLARLGVFQNTAT